MGTGSFSGIKRPGRGVDHPPLSSAEVEVRVELYIYSSAEPSWPVLAADPSQIRKDGSQRVPDQGYRMGVEELPTPSLPLLPM